MIFDNGTVAPESNCRRQHNALSVLKTDKNKTGNLRRKRMELRKMRIVAKEKMFGDSESSCTSGESPQQMRIGYIGFEEESIEEEETTIDVVVTRGVSSGMISVIGRRREMEDAVAVELDFLQRGGKSYDFFGVYDGHGGWRVAEACSEMLHKLLVKIILVESENCGDIINWGKVMGEGFKKMDEEVNNKNGREVAMTGSTAVVVVVGDDEVVVANCGDSRALIFRGGAVMQLSDDHKPDRPDELKRIEDIGGKVINWNGQRVLGVLATSRSIGDHYLKPFVINEPEVKVISRTDSDEFLILASDGLWDVVSNDLACELTKRCFDGKIRISSPREEEVKGSDRCGNNRASVAAAVLAELAIARGSGDNISVVVVELKRSAC